jgi:hypothetical protein
MSAAADFRTAAIRQERCAGCGRLVLWAGEAHHAIPKASLRDLFPDRPELVWDVRNAVLLCRLTCHGRHHVRFEPLARDKLPRDVFDFAAELGITWLLEKLYPEAEVAHG